MQVLTTADPERIRALRARDEFFWLDLAGPTDGDMCAVAEALELHPLALEDTLEFGQPPKLDPFDDHVLLVFYSARVVGDDEGFEPLEVHVYVHGGFVFTVRHAPCPSLEAVRERCEVLEGEVEERLVHRILDALADAYEPVVAAVDRRVDELEGEVLVRPERGHLTRVYRLKQDVTALLRRNVAQQEAFDVERILAVPGLEHGDRPYLRDVGDRLAETTEGLSRLNADLVALSDTFFNSSTHRLTGVATRLSVVAAVFFVATFITSFFGQNFEWLVESVNSRADFLVFGVGGLVASVVLCVAYFAWRRRDYFL